MKLTELFAQGRPSFSCEVYSPRRSDASSVVLSSLLQITELHPDFLSVTYGEDVDVNKLNGSTAAQLLERGVTPLSHLSCAMATREGVLNSLSALQRKGVENILALRGNAPISTEPPTLDYPYAADLVAECQAYGGFCVGAVCFPELLFGARNVEEDMEHLCAKVESGCDFLITQACFDNERLLAFIERARCAGIEVPIVAGIMPLTNNADLRRLILQGTKLPPVLRALTERFGGDERALFEAGVAYAEGQIAGLLGAGVNNFHIYVADSVELAKRLLDSFAHMRGVD